MSRYTRIQTTSIKTPQGSVGKVYYRGVKYPPIPLEFSDIYVYTEEGDRLDILAQQYYSDSSLWWIISSANDFLKQDSYYIPLGIQIRIPSNVGAIKANYYLLNQRR
jgi:phage tail protein X